MSKNGQYVGLDVSLKETSISVIDDADKIVWLVAATRAGVDWWFSVKDLTQPLSAITGTLSAIDRNHCPHSPESAKFAKFRLVRSRLDRV